MTGSTHASQSLLSAADSQRHTVALTVPSRWPWVVATAIALLMAGYTYWQNETAESRALRALPATERMGLYGRTLENLRAVCDPAPPRSLRDHCHEQAGFLRSFPECDGACQELVQRYRWPAR